MNVNVCSSTVKRWSRATDSYARNGSVLTERVADTSFETSSISNERSFPSQEVASSTALGNRDSKTTDGIFGSVSDIFVYTFGPTDEFDNERNGVASPSMFDITLLNDSNVTLNNTPMARKRIMHFDARQFDDEIRLSPTTQKATKSLQASSEYTQPYARKISAPWLILDDFDRTENLDEDEKCTLKE